MYPSSILCRAQEKLQRSRAAATPLANIRSVAEKAAAAWNLEAVQAEKREQRQDRTRVTALALADAKREQREQHERAFSENPDRGFTNP
ncbi:hypothetical protein [Sphingomonas sanxanigenens]|uniref:Uncharacterized protein n=1 Tax=Sphingomonas sanxanigenens DSM 19645 = NX02 TaxID=1123269 RepID=W0AHD9_9SPHN|nr:hypothetical protein [Sphingomonas sanxanigenens]AHE55962.1 hypothetical protein NX02_21655 [Sphingomonas sanxanigenens DSM 19645 = NX02]